MSYDPKAEYGYCIPLPRPYGKLDIRDTDEVIRHVLVRRMEKLIPNGTKWEVVATRRGWTETQMPREALCAYRSPEMDDPDYAWPDTWKRKRGDEELTFVRSMVMETSRLEDGTDVA